LITGCTKGSIGDALAREFHAKGLRVFAASRRLDSMERLSAMGIDTLELDVTDANAIQRVRDEIAALTGGKLDILMNNAGRSYVEAAIDEDIQIVRNLFEVNVFSVMMMVKEFAPLLIASRSGLIVNTGSAASVAPVPFGSTYNASKAALQAFTNTLRIELAPFNIQVVYLAAGGVKSNISSPKTLPPGSLYAPMEALFQERRIGKARSGRMEADDFAKVVVAEALKPKPRAWLWAGTNALAVWFVDTFLPRQAWDYIMAKQYGLDQFVRMLQAEKSKDA